MLHEQYTGFRRTYWSYVGFSLFSVGEYIPNMIVKHLRLKDLYLYKIILSSMKIPIYFFLYPTYIESLSTVNQISYWDQLIDNNWEQDTIELKQNRAG